MRIAMSVVYQERSYYYVFGDGQIVRVAANAEKETGIKIPGLKKAFRVCYQRPELRITDERSGKKLLEKLGAFFSDDETGLIVFCTEETPQQRKVLPQQYEISFGRCERRRDGTDNQLVIGLPFISVEHGKLLCDGKKTVIMDTDSMNGIYVNGKKVKKAQLFDGDVVSVYTMRMIYKDNSLVFENTGDEVELFLGACSSNGDEQGDRDVMDDLIIL